MRRKPNQARGSNPLGESPSFAEARPAVALSDCHEPLDTIIRFSVPKAVPYFDVDDFAIDAAVEAIWSRLKTRNRYNFVPIRPPLRVVKG